MHVRIVYRYILIAYVLRRDSFTLMVQLCQLKIPETFVQLIDVLPTEGGG